MPDGCSWYCGGDHLQIVSSHLPSIGNNNYNETSIFDGDARTAWVEGVEGYGIGEYVEVNFPITDDEYIGPRATVCYIHNGYNKNERTWKNNSRVKSFNLYLDGDLFAIVNLQDTRDEQYFILPDTIPNPSDSKEYKTMEFFGDSNYKVSTLRFEIADVYKGDKYDDTAISELFFDGINVHCILSGALITLADGSLKEIEKIETGDLLLTYDIGKMEYVSHKVKKAHSAYHSSLYTISLSNGQAITVTDDHPFLSEQGWVSVNPPKTKGYKRYSDVLIGELKVGSKLLIEEYKTAEVAAIERLEQTERKLTFTLEFEGSVAFIANGILVGQE